MIDILVPVLGRPERAQPLVDSIRAGTAVPHRIIFLCSPGDDPQYMAAAETQADVEICPFEREPGDYARKMNYGFRLGVREWVFTGSDDLRFHPGWDFEALEVAKATDAHVIGTNDLGNALVMRGGHATHSLIRRSYAEDTGASMDGPDTVYSEEYAHQYVDNELYELARRRGVWAFAEASRVEHMHPFWPDGKRGHKGKMDATYELGLSTSREDNRTFRRRRAMWKSSGRVV